MNLPADLVEELKVWKMAFGIAYADPSFSYGRMIRGMIDSLSDTEPGVVQVLDDLVAKNPALLEKLGNYNGVYEEEEEQ